MHLDKRPQDVGGLHPPASSGFLESSLEVRLHALREVDHPAVILPPKVYRDVPYASSVHGSIVTQGLNFLQARR